MIVRGNQPSRGVITPRDGHGVVRSSGNHRVTYAACSIVFVLSVLVPVVGCRSRPEQTVAAQATPQEFTSPEKAGRGHLTAAQSGDRNSILAIFGPNSKDLISTGNAAEDKATVAAFVTGYSQMHRWRKLTDGSQSLLIGADNFTFPIPLKQGSDTKWYFDTAAGKDEILRRRVGRNELAVIDVCGALADAQAQYFSLSRSDGSTHQYAAKFISDPGAYNGLYWESTAGQPKSPLGPLVALSTTEGYSAKSAGHTPFHGYYFRMLTQQGSQARGGAKNYVVDGKPVGGFAFVAYPADYGNTGVMTFLINQDGTLLQKNLGSETSHAASAMTSFDPDGTWSVV